MLIHLFVSHWPEVLGAVVSVLNALMRHYGKAKGFSRFLHTLVDVVSPFVRYDSPGTLKLPGTKSRAPRGDDEPVRGSGGSLPPLALLLLVATPGCAGNLPGALDSLHEVGVKARVVATHMCEAPRVVCEAKGQLDCAAVRRCEEIRDGQVYPTLEAYQSAVRAASVASDDGDLATVDVKVGAAMDLFSRIVKVLHAWGVSL